MTPQYISSSTSSRWKYKKHKKLKLHIQISLRHHSPLPFVGRSSLALLVDDNLVVHAKFALWHSAKVALHHDSARHVSAQNLACAGGRREFRILAHSLIPILLNDSIQADVEPRC